MSAASTSKNGRKTSLRSFSIRGTERNALQGECKIKHFGCLFFNDKCYCKMLYADRFDHIGGEMTTKKWNNYCNDVPERVKRKRDSMPSREAALFR